MDEMVEVVEEEVVVDDHDTYETIWYDNDAYAEYMIDEQEAAAVRIAPLNTTIIKVKPETVNPEKRKVRVAPTAITDVLIAAFSEKVVNPEHEVSPHGFNEKLDAIYHSGDWAIARDFPDSLLGELDLLMLHLPSSKLLLKEGDRARLLSAIVAKHQNSRNPIGTALQDIQKTYLGLPPIGQLRNILSLELRKIFPLVQPPVAPQPTHRRLEKRYVGWKKRKTYGFKKVVTDDEERIRKEKEKAKEDERPPAIFPIDDEIYEVLAEVIASGQRQPEMEYEWPMPIKALLAKGSLVAEQVDHTNVDLEEVIRAGWCIRERATGRIVPRRGDVHRIWRRIHSRMIRGNSTAQIIAYVEAKFVGITSREQRRTARTEDVYKGARVTFPWKPTVIGRRAMQYVQIDVIDPPYEEYPQEEMESALLVVDLHSHYAFCKPFPDADSSSDEMLRFLVDCFSAYGPPEGFLLTNEKNWEWIRQIMSSVESHFKVETKCCGFAKEHVSARAITVDAAIKTAGEGNFRWVETLDAAVLEWNQRPSKIYGFALSPFEVMFGRPAWRECAATSLPPWIGNREERERRERQERVAKEEGMRVESEELPPLRERIETIVTSLQSPVAVMDEDGRKVLDPGTGLKFEIGDRVYIRNLYFVDVPGGEAARSRGGEPKREDYRYLRGCVVEDDDAHPEFFYRVAYDPNAIDEDVLPYEEWPAIDDTEVMTSSWFSPCDLAPVSFQQCIKRSTDQPLEASDTACSCEVDCCDQLADEVCTRTRSAVCCARHEGGLCAAHTKARRGQKSRRKRKEVETVPSTQPEEADADTRYLLKAHQQGRHHIGGRLVKIARLPTPDLPEEILQERREGAVKKEGAEEEELEEQVVTTL